jgi:hypothetical protein
MVRGFSTAFDIARERAGTRVGELVGAMRHEGEGFLAGRKNQIAEQFADVGGAIRWAADKLLDSDNPLIGDYAGRAADRVEDVGRYIEQNDLRDMIEDARALARRRPLLFGGGMLLAGLAAARLLKAAATDGRSARGRSVRQ